MYNNDDDEENFFDDGEDLSFEDTMFKMSALKDLFRLSGKVEFFLDDSFSETEDDEGVPSFKFHPDTTFGFVI